MTLQFLLAPSLKLLSPKGLYPFEKHKMGDESDDVKSQKRDRAQFEDEGKS